MNPTKIRRRVTAVTLVEVLVSVCVMGATGVLLLGLLGQGNRGTARAGEVQLAVSLGARSMDVLLAQGFSGLAPRGGRDSSLMLGKMGPGRPDPAADPTKLVLDGVTFMGWCQFVTVKPGILRVNVTIMWEGVRGTERVSGVLPLVRLMADPGHGMSLRTPARGGAA